MMDVWFRGKSLYDGTWIHGDLAHAPKGLAIHPRRSTGMIMHYVDENTAGQYTGIDDSYGEEIYAGDIVCITQDDGSHVRAKIEYDDDGMKWVAGWENDCYDLGEFCSADLMVAGNIYDNPELLGGADDEH